MKNMKICFVIDSLQCGGAERVVSLMANHWAEQGWDITILTFDDGTQPSYYALHPKIIHGPLKLELTSVKRTQAYYENLCRIWGLRKSLKSIQPDAIISFIDITNIFTTFASFGLGVPLIISERSNPYLHEIGRLWNTLRFWVYPFTDRIVFQTKGVSSFFPQRIRNNSVVIPNPVFPIPCRTNIGPAFNSPFILSVGRLAEEKGFDLLISAFAQIAAKFPEWRLVIAGEGPLRPQLLQLLQKFHLEEKVDLPGKIQEIYSVYPQASLFVLSSRFEGFPNALCEAMAAGLPVIATDCAYGPSEIIQHDINGLLVPVNDLDALSNALENLIADVEKRNFLATNAAEITKNYSMDYIMGLWETTIQNTTTKKYLPRFLSFFHKRAI